MPGLGCWVFGHVWVLSLVPPSILGQGSAWGLLAHCISLVGIWSALAICSAIFWSAWSLGCFVPGKVDVKIGTKLIESWSSTHLGQTTGLVVDCSVLSGLLVWCSKASGAGICSAWPTSVSLGLAGIWSSPRQGTCSAWPSMSSGRFWCCSARSFLACTPLWLLSWSTWRSWSAWLSFWPCWVCSPLAGCSAWSLVRMFTVNGG